MKIQLDFTNKIIKVEGTVSLKELINNLSKLLPSDSKYGHWQTWALETNTTIVNWSQPIIIEKEIYPPNPWQPYQPNIPYYSTGTEPINCDVNLANFQINQ